MHYWYAIVSEQQRRKMRRLTLCSPSTVVSGVLTGVYRLNAACNLVPVDLFARIGDFSYIRMHTCSRLKLRKKVGVYSQENIYQKALL